MAVTRKFADDDATLGVGSIITSRSRNYSDLANSFTYNTNTGDLYLSKDAAAVKQSIRNLVLTDYGERPFKPYIGSGVRGLLFELADDTTATLLKDAIRRTIENYEPRARVLSLKVELQEERNHILVRLEFQIVNTTETVVLEVNLERLR